MGGELEGGGRGRGARGGGGMGDFDCWGFWG